MKRLTDQEIESLRRRWREILKRAQEKGQKPSAAEIQAAHASNDLIIMELVEETKMALEEHNKRLLDKLKTNPEDFQSAANVRKPSLFTTLLRQPFKPKL